MYTDIYINTLKIKKSVSKIILKHTLKIIKYIITYLSTHAHNEHVIIP